MYKVVVVKTNDGESFESADAALKHLDKKFGDALTFVARKLVEIDKYEKMVAYLDVNLNMFQSLLDIRAEIIAGIEND